MLLDCDSDGVNVDVDDGSALGVPVGEGDIVLVGVGTDVALWVDDSDGVTRCEPVAEPEPDAALDSVCDTDGELETDADSEELCDHVGELDGVGDGLREPVGDAELDSVGDGVGSGLGDAVPEPEPEWVPLGVVVESCEVVADRLAVADPLGESVCDSEGLWLEEGVLDGEGEGDDDSEPVAEGVRVGVAVIAWDSL